VEEVRAYRDREWRSLYFRQPGGVLGSALGQEQGANFTLLSCSPEASRLQTEEPIFSSAGLPILLGGNMGLTEGFLGEVFQARGRSVNIF
jgi:hypothetical protein